MSAPLQTTAAVAATAAVPADAWLEVALNGSWGSTRQPLVPVSPQQIVAEAIACAQEGAAIVHYHGFDMARGQPSDALDLHRRIVEGIRERVDVLVYPTTASRKLRPGGSAELAEDRFALARGLAEAGLLDCLVIDPGSHLMFDTRMRWQPYVYVNFDEDIAAALALCRQAGAVPGFAIYEPGYARVGEHRARELRALGSVAMRPIHRAMFSDTLLYGLPPGEPAIAAYAALFAGLETRWMMAGLDFDIRPWLRPALAAGADIRVGLEDAPHGCDRGNVAQVREAVQAVAASGRRLATAAEVRAGLAVQATVTNSGAGTTAGAATSAVSG